MVRLRPSEGQGWLQAGQYLHFSAHLESLADQYLVALFGLWTKRSIPPFISVHIRRGDFEQARGLTSIEAFTDAVQRVRDTLDRRMDDPAGWAGAGHPHQRYFKGVRGKDYAVVVTTDESMDSEFVRHIRAELGWRVLDHDHMRTVDKLGEWYPTMIDAAVLARGRGFVGYVLGVSLSCSAVRCGTERSRRPCKQDGMVDVFLPRRFARQVVCFSWRARRLYRIAKSFYARQLERGRRRVDAESEVALSR